MLRLIIFFKVAFLAQIILYNPVFSQANKVSQSKKSTSPTIGPLKFEDFKYYVLLRRGDYFESNPSSLKNNSNSLGFTSDLVIVDSRTLKELMWWPVGETFLRDKALYSITPSNYGNEIRKFTITGILEYSKTLRTEFNGRSIPVYLSKDFRNVYFFDNGDIWIGNFALESGSISDIKQVTHTGILKGHGFDHYMVGETIVAGGYIFNLTDGSFEICGTGGYVPMSSQANKFIISYPVVTDSKNLDEVWDLETRKVVFSKYKTLIRLWINNTQTKLVYYLPANERKRTSAKNIVVDLASNPIREYSVSWSAIPISNSEQRGTVWFSIKNRLSPNGKYFFQAGGDEKSPLGMYIYDNETLEESFIPLDLKGNMWRRGTYYPEARWTDNSHLLLPATDGSSLNGQDVTISTQGTYILDLKSKVAKRVTPYLINNDKDKVVSLVKAGLVLFNANNYLFSCKSNGDDIKQNTTKPRIYEIVSSFLEN